MSFKINIEKKTTNNTYYRNVLYTNSDMQLVVMNLLPNEKIDREKHNGSQFIRVEEGSGIAIVKNKRYILKNGSGLIINPNTYHNIIAGDKGMKLYSIYTPPQHKKGTKEKSKKDD